MNKVQLYKRHILILLLSVITVQVIYGQKEQFTLPVQQYQDRVQAIWTAQMLGAIMGFPFEHKVASTKWIDQLNPKVKHAPVDDDWYYEMVAIRAFEKYGVSMTVSQLGKQWIENSAGTWGSSEQARLLMMKSLEPPHTGHPRYNKLWYSIGPQFSCDVYGALAPGMPNLAAELARNYGHINGFAEGLDGGVFVAGIVSLGFSETDTKVIVRKAAQLIHPSSPYRKCLDMIIELADKGKTATEIFKAVEDEWRIEYPASNNAVANGGIVATSVWFGDGDFLKTINLAFGAADFTDADCNAANAAAVVGAMHGMKALPTHLVKTLNDSIIGEKMGKLTLTPSVNESISELAQRTTAIGIQLMQTKGAKLSSGNLVINLQQPITQPAELFDLAELTQYWNKDWKLERAGFGGAQGGMPGIRGITWLNGEVLATYPRDEARGVVLSRTIELDSPMQLSFVAGVDSLRMWKCEVYQDNKKIYEQIFEGTASGQKWYPVNILLTPGQEKTTRIRLYQRVLVPGRASGTAYWKNLKIE